MTTRTSRKQMHEANEMLRTVFGKGNLVYAAGEYDASGHAYIMRDGEITKYKNNTEAYLAACEMVCDAEI